MQIICHLYYVIPLAFLCVLSHHYIAHQSDCPANYATAAMAGRLVIVMHGNNLLMNKQTQFQLGRGCVHFCDFCFELPEWKWMQSEALRVTTVASYSSLFRMLFVSHFLLHEVFKQRHKRNIVIANKIVFILHCNAQAQLQINWALHNLPLPYY